MAEGAHAWIRAVDDGAAVDVWVVPNAARTGIAGIHDDRLRVRVAAPPTDGRVNATLVRFLKEVAGGKATVTKGAGSRRKTLLIWGVGVQDARERLLAAAPTER